MANTLRYFKDPIVLIRLAVGVVFLSEGIQKFIYPALRGGGRFENIGLPFPEFLGYFVGATEIICGVLVIVGISVRYAVLPLIAIMMVAFLTTKQKIFLEKGFWEVMHASRTDWSMLLCSVYLFFRNK